jgi:hypothetical protein
VSELNDIAAGMVNPEIRYTEDGELEAMRIETGMLRRSAALAATVLHHHHEAQIAKGLMRRCRCGGAFYQDELPKHERLKHEGDRR